MSDTPRTDAKAVRARQFDTTDEVVDAHFARQLERELANERIVRRAYEAKIEQLESEQTSLIRELAAAREYAEELRAALLRKLDAILNSARNNAAQAAQNAAGQESLRAVPAMDGAKNESPSPAPAAPKADAQTGEIRVQTLGEGTPEQWIERGRQDALAEWNKRVDGGTDK